MTLFSYEIFDAVARQGSFNKAAQQLHLTPSAISHAIAVMEEELGFALFNRGKNGVSMTSYGASLYPSIRDVLNSDEALKQSIARLNGLEKGKVKLGVFNSVCASLLPGLLKSFMTHYPQIEIEVYQGTYDDVKEWLRTGQVDIAFLSSTCREEFNLTELFREPLLCIVPQDWPEPENGVMTPALMNGQSFVVQCDATDAEMRQFLKKYKIGTEPLPCHRRPVQHRHGGSRSGHFHHAADAAARLQGRDQNLSHRARGRPCGGPGCAAPRRNGPGSGTDVPPHRGLLQADRAEMSRTPLYYTIKQSVCGAWTVFLLRKSDCISVQNPLYLEKQAGFMQKP